MPRLTHSLMHYVYPPFLQQDLKHRGQSLNVPREKLDMSVVSTAKSGGMQPSGERCVSKQETNRQTDQTLATDG